MKKRGLTVGTKVRVNDQTGPRIGTVIGIEYDLLFPYVVSIRRGTTILCERGELTRINKRKT
jgi:hypothetical protein